MTDKTTSPRITALQELEAALDEHRRAQPNACDAQPHASAQPLADADPPPNDPEQSRRWGLRRPGWRLPFNLWSPFDRRHPVVRGLTIGVLALFVLVLIGGGALWWRLSSGPIMLDLVTPWLTSAIEQNLGGRYRVEVGGTQLERDAQGHTAVRLRDIVLRNAAGALVAVAPKAEVAISGTSLLFASPRAKSVRLVDANMTIRIDPDGRANVLLGGDQPFASIAPVRVTPPATARAQSGARRTATDRAKFAGQATARHELAAGDGGAGRGVEFHCVAGVDRPPWGVEH